MYVASLGPNKLLLKNRYYLTHAWRDMEAHTFAKSINPKVYVIRLLGSRNPTL